ncbi:MAG: hypothetical protein Crog4KO_32240 [Crocinitomicaceae bacterium]
MRILYTLSFLVFLAVGSSCGQLKGVYVPLDADVKNPYNQLVIVKVYSAREKDTVEYVQIDEVPFPHARPYRDTIVFLSGKRVKAWSRPTTASCTMRVSRLEELEYSVRKDTLISKHVHYLMRGDTLYPLHYGAIYVKD